MARVNDIFQLGPDAVIEFFAGKISTRSDALDIKELADICWTRASTLAKSQASDAAKWARAALAGYELLSTSDEPSLAESASESAEALRSWKLLQN
ncbi:MAG TPA: hypothetical protein VM008_10755 [Phycisphaerae bacterium]|nr:hypothetical protein [Phycisphaerae bacterium]